MDMNKGFSQSHSEPKLTNIVHVHEDCFSCHRVESEDVFSAVIEIKCVAIEGSRLDVVLCSHTRHMPSYNFPITESQMLTTLKHITVNRCEEKKDRCICVCQPKENLPQKITDGRYKC